MLPTRLGQVKIMLEEKRKGKGLSTSEGDLLTEIRFLERKFGPVFIKSGTMPKKMLKILTGPADRCPCCGRKD